MRSNKGKKLLWEAELCEEESRRNKREVWIENNLLCHVKTCGIH